MLETSRLMKLGGTGMFELHPKRSYVDSVMHLIGHLLSTAAIFGIFALLVWLLSALVHMLNSIHPFPTAVYAFIEKMELWAAYADAVLCVIVLAVGALRFCRDLMRS